MATKSRKKTATSKVKAKSKAKAKAASKKKPARARAAAAPKKRVAKAKPVAKAKAKPKAKAKVQAKAKAKPKAKAKAKPAVRRRDATGHLDRTYAATLRRKSREGRVRDSDDAFVGRTGHTTDVLAEELGETWVATATSGEDKNEDEFNQAVPEDEGGPFVTTNADQEFARGTDASNPKSATREPFPRT